MNKEVTSELVPPATTRKSDRINKDPRILQARKRSRDLYQKYQMDPSERNKQDYQDAKREIDNIYANILQEKLEGKITEKENADKNNQARSQLEVH